MKPKNRLQLLILILTALVFSAQDLEHIVFHSCVEPSSCYSHDSDAKHSAEVKDFDGSVHKIFSKSICLICNSIAAKSTKPVNVRIQLTGLGDSIYPQVRETLSYGFYRKPNSRGPPAV